ncbi:unnamed protein product [Moneuplotes crassus]|uniref:Uncharacterized protein n=1 Tax=Euplotes crassus TaxID=5936 RepID=A0AAD1YBN3_EUPCR|nr:unnamed protein product [Moneuplotes crassus]
MEKRWEKLGSLKLETLCIIYNACGLELLIITLSSGLNNLSDFHILGPNDTCITLLKIRNSKIFFHGNLVNSKRYQESKNCSPLTYFVEIAFRVKLECFLRLLLHRKFFLKT